MYVLSIALSYVICVPNASHLAPRQGCFPVRPEQLRQFPILWGGNLDIARATHDDLHLPPEALHQLYVVGSLKVLLAGLAMRIFEPIAPKALGGLHPVETVARDGLAKTGVGSVPHRINDGQGQGGGSVGPDGLDHGHQMPRLHKGANRIVDEHHIDLPWDDRQRRSNRLLPRRSTGHHRRQLRQPYPPQFRLQRLGGLTRSRHEQMIDLGMTFEDTQRLHQEGFAAETPELFATTTQACSFARSRDQHSNLSGF